MKIWDLSNEVTGEAMRNVSDLLGGYPVTTKQIQAYVLDNDVRFNSNGTIKEG